jgi:hypothetical protein
MKIHIALVLERLGSSSNQPSIFNPMALTARVRSTRQRSHSYAGLLNAMVHELCRNVKAYLSPNRRLSEP